MKIERIKLTDLRPDEQNARKHDQANLKAIAGSLDQFGQRKPIVITQDNRVVAGNGTLTAAKLLDWKEIDCVRVPADWTADQIKAYALADNRTAELAEWDEQVMASQLLELQEAGFDIEEFGFELVNPPTEDESEAGDEIPEIIESRTKLGEIWQLGRHRLMCGDSADKKSLDLLLSGNTIEAIITDPPYGIGIDGQRESKNKNPKHNRKAHEFRNWDNERPSKEVFDLLLSMKVPSVIWGGNYFADLLPASRGWLYWNKGQDGLTMSDGELAWTSEHKPLRAITINRAALQGSVHPTQKPAQVIEFSIDYLENKKIILDLFGGSGTTLIVCEKTNRTCFMMELDPKYCDVIIQRWENLTGQKAELVNASR